MSENIHKDAMPCSSEDHTTGDELFIRCCNKQTCFPSHCMAEFNKDNYLSNWKSCIDNMTYMFYGYFWNLNYPNLCHERFYVSILIIHVSFIISEEVNSEVSLCKKCQLTQNIPPTAEDPINYNLSSMSVGTWNRD